MPQTQYVAVVINKDGDGNVVGIATLCCSRDKALVDEAAKKQERLLAPTQQIDIFDVEELL